MSGRARIVQGVMWWDGRALPVEQRVREALARLAPRYGPACRIYVPAGPDVPAAVDGVPVEPNAALREPYLLITPWRLEHEPA